MLLLRYILYITMLLSNNKISKRRQGFYHDESQIIPLSNTEFIRILQKSSSKGISLQFIGQKHNTDKLSNKNLNDVI